MSTNGRVYRSIKGAEERFFLSKGMAEKLGYTVVAVYERTDDIEKLREIARAARDLEETLAKLIEIDETELTSTDLGAAAIQDRLNALHKALELVP